MKEKEVETLILEDNKEYAIIDEIEYNNYNYLYLSDIKNPKSFCIRKEEKNDKTLILGLDDNKEFDDALERFAKKHINEV